jgi:hypothetical protein
LANYHTRTPESDVAAGNSITVGQNLHQDIKKQLQERWDNEPGDASLSKGELSRRAYAQMEADDAARRSGEHQQRSLSTQIGRVFGIAKNPGRLMRGTVRRVRVKVGR